ncbi:universal stress protein [Niabella drilacis]|uniref:Nucleotide-binding universal stress protein, UspA family n=1 Tax=Niabella drilacis (strain DSM 25811 / CCM 8410 / CCUG 62505 / LMG 26954 / E90) TaxID=1285928 RepID=A0A1G6KV46_NIADE|nr:universal stress protein [Niabella drilacis]SDC34813.1 Nucleotide-binding universal stress protein, UspA family [Niabella drilacis]
MKKILALTDFSENAEHAIHYAMRFVPFWQTAELALLHVYEPPVLFQADPSGGMGPEGTSGLINYTLMAEQAATLAESSREKLEAFKTELAARYPSVAITARVTEGFLGDMANELSEKEGYELIVMGITGKSGLEKILIGSNAVKAIESLHSPLLIVPPQPANALPDKIALASDLELLTTSGIGQLEQFMNGLPVQELQMVTINKNPADPVNQERISALKAQLHLLNPVAHFVQAPHVENGLEHFVTEHHISLLVFVHHERSFIGQLFHKSISKQIAWNTTIPVLRLKNRL